MGAIGDDGVFAREAVQAALGHVLLSVLLQLMTGHGLAVSASANLRAATDLILDK